VTLPADRQRPQAASSRPTSKRKAGTADRPTISSGCRADAGTRPAPASAEKLRRRHADETANCSTTASRTRSRSFGMRKTIDKRLHPVMSRPRTSA